MLRRTFVLLAGLALAPGTLHATNGYFSHGYGTQSKGMAGAGAALCLSALAPALNPAALVCVGDRFDVGVGVFNPNRSYTVSGRPSGFPGTFGLAPGTVESGSRYFPIPHLGFSRRLGGRQAVGVAVYGNGGMNTDYAARTFHGASPTGVDLSQLFLAPTWAVSAGRHSFGVSGIVAYQRFRLLGAQAFGAFSADARALTDNGHDSSFGAGARFGYQGRLSDRFSAGASYQTRIWMGAFDRYAGLFAGRGDFDVPDNWTVGVAFQPAQAVTLAADVQQVRYSQVAAVGNPMLPNMHEARLGDAGGPGFGWRDMTTWKLGAEWRAARSWTWRAGYSYGDQPIRSSEVLLNILAPGVMRQHATLGVSRKLGGGKELGLAVMRAFAQDVSGPNPMEMPGQQEVGLAMDQWELELSFSIRLGR